MASVGLLIAVQPCVGWAAEGLNLIPDPAFLIANVVLFGLLVYPVNKLMIGPLVRILREREERTAGSTDEADALLAQATLEREQLDDRSAAARRAAAERRGQILAAGKAEEQSLIDAARADAAETISQVRTSLEADLVQARDGLRADAGALAEEAAARILGRTL
jgi:F-type H+-transporting ATPase subunit b